MLINSRRKSFFADFMEVFANKSLKSSISLSVGETNFNKAFFLLNCLHPFFHLFNYFPTLRLNINFGSWYLHMTFFKMIT